MTAQQTDTIPRVQHIPYFQAALNGIAAGLTFDGLRGRLREVSVDLARRFQGRVTSSRISDSHTFWSPTADSVEEVMRLGFVERRALPSKRANVDAHRDATYSLTPHGRETIAQTGDDDSAFRRIVTPLLLKQHPYFSGLCAVLAEQPLLIPEYTEEELKALKLGTSSWTSALGADVAERVERATPGVSASAEMITSRVRDGLSKRFSGGADPSAKDILDAVLDALVAASLQIRGLKIDATTFNILTSWGRQLFVLNESRYVAGRPGRSVWTTADVTLSDQSVVVSRRGISGLGDRVASELATAYRQIADTRAAELGGSSVRYPHLEIFKVRALAAYRARVNDPVVDRVIAEIAQRTRPAPFRIELALGAGGWQASSESPFRMGNRRYYVMLVKPEGAENE